MKRLISFWLVSACCLCLCLIPRPADAEAIRFYVGELFPFIYMQGEGAIAGAAVDLVSEMMIEAGLPVGPKSFTRISWPRAIEDTKTIAGTAIFCMARTDSREHLFKWVGPIAHLKLGMVSLKSRRIVINDPEEVLRYRIGVIRNSGPHEMLVKRWGNRKKWLTLLTDNEQQFRMLEQGRVDLITQADVAAPYYIKGMGLKPKDFEMPYVMKELPLYVAFNPETSDAVIDSLQNALDKLKRVTSGRSRYDEILAHHIGESPLQTH